MRDTPLFRQVLASQSNIEFSNLLKEDVSSKANLLDFDYFYNGAGVALCDLNNDDLPDIFFTGNQVDNKLYINQGNLVFKDVTETSGINVGKYWSNGICFTDINNDGWLDLYISQGGPNDRTHRKNMLLINQKDLTFKEMALEYGLDDEGISSQSAFFDFDNDGDQDCIVMNESELYGYDPITFNRMLVENPQRYRASFSHLYENRNGRFVDVSEAAGIQTPTFGLGLAISDLNEDGWLDIYITNDYYLPDNLYINRKNGTFSDRTKSHLEQISFFGMGIDIADINDDAHQDILVLDMASQDHIRSKTLMASMNVDNFNLLVKDFGFANQYMFNTLQLNDGSGHFGNVAHMTGMAKTDWSWAALANDYDLDGDKDVLVTNGYRRYALDNDFKRRVQEVKLQYSNQVPFEVKKSLYAEMPSEALPNLFFRNDGDLHFTEIASEVGLQMPTFSNGAAAADLDNDGDLDLVISNIDQPALLYENQVRDQNQANFLRIKLVGDRSGNAKISAQCGDKISFIEPQSVRGYFSSMVEDAVFGLGDAKQVDTLRVKFIDGREVLLTKVKGNQTLVIDHKEARVVPIQDERQNRALIPYAASGLGLDYVHKENQYNDFAKEILLPQKQSTLGPFSEVADVNADGLDDLLLGGDSRQATTLYIQQSDGRFIKSFQKSFEQDAGFEDMESEFFDLDGDQDLDLLIISGGNSFPAGDLNYEDRLYINDGQGNFSRIQDPALKGRAFSGKCIKKIDFDQDGDDDIIIGNRIIPQSYPVAAPSYILENRDGRFFDRTPEIAPQLENFGIVNDIEVVDLNGDGWDDFIIAGEWSGIGIFYNEQGVFRQRQDSTLRKLTGWWFSVHATDVNMDGRPDLVVGNVGENMKHKASSEKPFRVYATDFDNTGNLDIVLSSTYKGEYVPVRGRECSSQQMPVIAEKFKTYSEFAEASLVDIYGDDKLNSAYTKEAVTFKSILLINGDNDSFEIVELPRMAQMFPLLDLVEQDVNGDGYPDLIVAGCIYNTEVETPRLDNGHGMVLLSDQEGNYKIGDPDPYRIFIPGNVKSLNPIQIKGSTFLLATRNNGALSLFKFLEETDKHQI